MKHKPEFDLFTRLNQGETQASPVILHSPSEGADIEGLARPDAFRQAYNHTLVIGYELNVQNSVLSWQKVGVSSFSDFRPFLSTQSPADVGKFALFFPESGIIFSVHHQVVVVSANFLALFNNPPELLIYRENALLGKTARRLFK